MRSVRPFTLEDLPAVVALRRRTFRYSRWDSAAELEQYFRRVFFNNPWYDEGLPSLIYDVDGEVAGFLGVLPRPFKIGDRAIRGAVTTQFMVAEEHRGIAGALLIRAVLAGPQDLLIADVANEAAQRMWDGLGGSTARLYSLFWSRSLRPCRSTMYSMGGNLAARMLRVGAKPVLNACDALMASLPYSRSSPPRPPGRVTTLTPGSMVENFAALAGPRALRPDYDEVSVKWLLDQVAGKWDDARLCMMEVRLADDSVAGWFVFVVQSNDIAEVLQIVATAEHRREVIQHMIRFAWEAGAIRLGGRIEPAMVDDLAANGCRFAYGGRGLFSFAKETALLHHVLRGEALLSGLEGEWWMQF